MSDATCTVGCGACCDPVILPVPLASMTAWTTERVRELGDPNDDATWEGPWSEALILDDDARDWARSYWERVQRDGQLPNADFAAKHWHALLGPELPSMVGGQRVWCDAFDRRTRTCTVHHLPVEEGGQPPICSDYPHYGLPPGDPGIAYGRGMDPACSYNAEVRTFLPIVEVR